MIYTHSSLTRNSQQYEKNLLKADEEKSDVCTIMMRRESMEVSDSMEVSCKKKLCNYAGIRRYSVSL